MKKILLLLSAITTFCTLSFAQGQGNVTVTNNTGCDVTVAAYASCPDGSNYTVNVSTVIPAGATVTLPYPAFGTWSPSAPTCENWQWHYATASYFDPALPPGGGSIGQLWAFGGNLGPFGYGLPQDLFPGGQITDALAVATEFGCNGKSLTTWDWIPQPNGDVQININ